MVKGGFVSDSHFSVSNEDRIQSTDDEADAVILSTRNTQIYMKAGSGQVLAIYRAVLFNKKVCKGVASLSHAPHIYKWSVCNNDIT